MVAPLLSPLPMQRFVDVNGNAASGYKVFTYQAGTTTKFPTYTDSTGATQNTNPVILNQRGEAPVWLDPAQTYKIVLALPTDTDPPSSPIWTVDNVGTPMVAQTLAGTSGAGGAAYVGFDGTTLANFFLSKNNRVVDSIAALRGLSKALYTRAFVTGYYAAGDGGGGAYYYDPTDTTSADNGGTIIVASDGGRWKLQVLGAVSVRQFGAKGDGATDDTTAFTNAAANSLYIYVPPSNSGQYYKITTTITLRATTHIFGAQQGQSVIGAWACNAFTINGTNGDNVTVEYMELRNYTAGGVIDAKSNIGVYCVGTNANHVNYFTANKLYIRGFSNGIEWDYTWSSLINDVTTVNIGAEAVRLFGQSVNNTIANSRLGANGGNSSIRTVKDGATKGEGLMVVNCLLGQGAYGIQSDGFLSLDVSNCTIDLITNIGIDLTNVPAFNLSNCWVYAALYGVHFQALGTPVDQGASLIGNYITVTGTTVSKAVYVEANNQGVSVVGGELTCSTNGRLVHVDGSGVCVTGVRGVNTGANLSVFFNGVDCRAWNNTGSMGVQWNVGVPSQGLAPVAALVFAGASGTSSVATACSVVRNGVGDYTVTFAYPLATASYVPLITADRGGNGATGYAITSQLAGSFRFTCTNQAGTAVDPPSVSVVVFN